MPVIDGKFVTLEEWFAAQERVSDEAPEPVEEPVADEPAKPRRRASKKEAAAQIMASLGIENEAEASPEDES